MALKVVHVFDNSPAAQTLAEKLRQDPHHTNVNVYVFTGVAVINHAVTPAQVVLKLNSHQMLFIVEAQTV